ncbi:MAG: cysteine--tRNA ligase [Rhodospirillaceae bacterium]|nr:MAG: cysteine--tRNA ligase [Rhodospirillaceae bacterium]
MPIQLFNTLKRIKEDFVPIDPERVRMYVCGPTVYDFAHIGNARPVVAFDILYRLLRETYGVDHVIYARNITDVDDKIIARAAESGEKIGDLTQRTELAFLDDMGSLGAMVPDIQPRATEHIAGMVTMIADLIKSGHAYVAEDHVLFNVSSYDDYGHLSGRNRDEMIAGARVEIAPYKQDPADFVLWKPSAEDQPGWDSPWGRGRPGWHIECSAMSEKHLGRTFDIHGGGQDLIFPHHENEVAQSTCAHGGETFVNYWLHNGYVMVEGEKMSKSLGNFYTVHDLLDEFPGEAIRLALLKTHYRKPLDFTKGGLQNAKMDLDKLYRALKETPAQSSAPSNKVMEALKDDLNTPLAMTYMFELAQGGGARDQLLASGKLLGILQHDPEDWFKGKASGDDGGLSDTDIDDLIEKRKQARVDKDFALSDSLRDELQNQGIILEDGAQGTTWRRS